MQVPNQIDLTADITRVDESYDSLCHDPDREVTLVGRTVGAGEDFMVFHDTTDYSSDGVYIIKSMPHGTPDATATMAEIESCPVFEVASYGTDIDAAYRLVMAYATELAIKSVREV